MIACSNWAVKQTSVKKKPLKILVFPNCHPFFKSVVAGADSSLFDHEWSLLMAKIKHFFAAENEHLCSPTATQVILLQVFYLDLWACTQALYCYIIVINSSFPICHLFLFQFVTKLEKKIQFTGADNGIVGLIVKVHFQETPCLIISLFGKTLKK